jgi:hypothetical protein
MDQVIVVKKTTMGVIEGSLLDHIIVGGGYRSIDYDRRL